MFNIYFANLLPIDYLFHAFTLNSLSVSRINFELTIFCTNSLWIHYQFRKFTMNSLSFSSFDYILHWFTMNWLSFPAKTLLIRNLCREFIIFYANSQWIREKTIFTIFFAKSLWIHTLFRKFTVNSLSVTRIYYESIYISVNSLWLHYMFIIFPLILLLVDEITLN